MQRHHALRFKRDLGSKRLKFFKEAFTHGNQEKSSQEKEEKVAE
jgi:hypothetical protein